MEFPHFQTSSFKGETLFINALLFVRSCYIISLFVENKGCVSATSVVTRFYFPILNLRSKEFALKSKFVLPKL